MLHLTVHPITISVNGRVTCFRYTSIYMVVFGLLMGSLFHPVPSIGIVVQMVDNLVTFSTTNTS